MHNPNLPGAFASDDGTEEDILLDPDEFSAAMSQAVVRTTYDTILVDANGVVHSVYHAAKSSDNETPDTLPASVARAVLQKLDSIVSAHPLARVVLAWDGRDNRAYRRALYPAYKAGRGEKESTLVSAMRLVYTGARQRHWEQPVREDYEADDIIASLVRQFHLDRARPPHPGETPPQRCLVVSEDGDLQQLVSAHVHQYHPKRADYVTPLALSTVGGRSGYDHGHAKAIKGDGGDNIPGVPGIGETHATAALREVPGLVHQCVRGESPDWRALPDTTFNAFLRAGRKITHPVLVKGDKRVATEARALKSVEGVIREAWRLVALEDGLE